MRPKLHKTLTDYIVIGISPTLIMFLVGSLVFFLLTAFYHGNYPARLTTIFACFVMAAVLIARIAMENGKEYASLFAFPLAIVTVMAMFRFVRIEGPLSAIGMPINIGLVALVWWSAHKLTWDCTLIDESEDATGEGLLQTIGFDSADVTDGPKAGEAGGDDDSQSAAGKDGDWGQWWRKFVERQRQPHAPGVWVIYFSLAALPLFGFGQWFISGDANRRFAFLLLCVYVASGMALLLTTSFLGLRRYLRQRRLEMPADMAGIWLAVGVLMIVVLLLICSVLPRPSSEFAVSEFPVRFGSPDHQQTNQHAFGNDGPQQPQGSGSRSDLQSDSSSRQGNQTQGKGETQSGEKKGSQGPSSQNGQKGKGQGAKAQGGGGEKGTSSGSGKQDDGANNSERGPQSEGKPSEGKSSGGEGRDKEQAGKPSGGQESRGEKSRGEESESQPSGNQSQDRRNDAKQGRGEKQGHGEETRESRSADKTKQDRRSQSQSQGQQNTSRDQRRPESQVNDRQQQNQQQQNQQQQPTPQRRSVVQLASRGISLIFKLIFYAILLGVVAFLAWKYRDQIREVFAQWLEQLRRLWERLFGGAPVDSADGASETVTRPAWRPFSSYEDPFASGLASQYSTEQLVRYSFEAMEAWARDHGCARQEDQTPLEFARQVARQAPVLANEAQVLGDLYSRVAYGHERLARSRQSDLQELWRQLKHAAPSLEAPA